MILLPIAKTDYKIDLTGTIINRYGEPLKSDYSQQDRRNTRIYFKPRIIKKRRYGKLRVRRKYKVVSNARLLIETLFVIPFTYKIFYIDGNKRNTSLENLYIKDTTKYYTTNTYEPTYWYLKDYLDMIKLRYEMYKEHPIMFQKIVLSLHEPNNIWYNE